MTIDARNISQLWSKASTPLHDSIENRITHEHRQDLTYYNATTDWRERTPRKEKRSRQGSSKAPSSETRSGLGRHGFGDLGFGLSL